MILLLIAAALIPLTFSLNYMRPYSQMHGGPGALLLTAPLLAGVAAVSLLMFLAAITHKFGRGIAVLALLPAIVACAALLYFTASLFGWL